MSDLKTETTHPPSPAVIQHCDYKYKALRQSRLKKKKQSSCVNWGREGRRWTAESRGEKGSFTTNWGRWWGDGLAGERSKQFCSNWTKRNSSSSSFFLSNFILFYIAKVLPETVSCCCDSFLKNDFVFHWNLSAMVQRWEKTSWDLNCGKFFRKIRKKQLYFVSKLMWSKTTCYKTEWL